MSSKKTQRKPNRVGKVYDPHNCLQKRLDYEGDVGYDLACPADEVVPADGKWYDINTEVRIEPPPGFWIELCSRSSTLSRGIMVARAIIDAGYRGPLVMRLKCEGGRGVYLRAGDRIAQLILHPVIHTEWETVKEPDALAKSDRGDNGFGSTG